MSVLNKEKEEDWVFSFFFFFKFGNEGVFMSKKKNVKQVLVSYAKKHAKWQPDSKETCPRQLLWIASRFSLSRSREM